MVVINADYYKFAETGMRNFSDATSFHGFNELYHAKTKFWKFIWFIIVTAAMTMTVYQVYGAVLTYMGQSSITIITPVEKGGLIYPPLDVCYLHWMTWVDYKKATRLNFTKKALLYSFTYITNPTFSYEIFDVHQARTEMLNAMTMNNITTLSQLYRMVARPFPLVMALLGGGFLIDNPPFFNNVTFRTVDTDIYLCYTLSGEEILDILKQQQQQPSSITSTGRTVFNFSIQDPMFSRDYNYFSTADEYNFRIGNFLSKKTNYWLPALSDYQKNYTGFTFPIRLFPDAYSDNYVEISKENDKYNIDMTPTVHRLMNTVTNPCVEGAKQISTEHQCEDICRAKLQKKTEVCLSLPVSMLLGEDTPADMCAHGVAFIPLLLNGSGSQSPSTIPNVNKTLSATDKEKAQTDFETCIHECYDSCEIWKYQYTKYITTLAIEARTLSFKNQTDINIVYPEESDVLVMIDADARTWEDFVGNVGGLLGVWTGASIISFLELVYLCCCKEMTCDCCTVDQTKFGGVFKKKQSTIKNDRESSANSISRNMPMLEVGPPPINFIIE